VPWRAPRVRQRTALHGRPLTACRGLRAADSTAGGAARAGRRARTRPRTRPQQAVPGEDAPRRSAPSQPARGKRRHADEGHASHELPSEAGAPDSPTQTGRDSPPRARKRRTAATAAPSAAHLSALAAQAAELGAAADLAQAHESDSAAVALPACVPRRARTRYGESGASTRPARRVVARGGSPRRSAPADAGARALAAVELGEQDTPPPAAHKELDQASLELGGAGAGIDLPQIEADLHSDVNEAIAIVAVRGLAE
jgi:hypothetical protein